VSFPVRTLSFPRRHWAPFRLPASRRYSPRQAELTGLIAGPSSAFRSLKFRVRLFSSLRLVVAPPTCEPDQDTSMTVSPASWPLSARSTAAVDGVFARCHGSRLLTLRLLFIHRSAVSFLTSPTRRKVFMGLAATRVLPGSNVLFVTPFGAFGLADPLRPPEPFARADPQ
jgi:hypothetical protein